MRDSNRAAARRSGRSLGDWLDDAIRDDARYDDDEDSFEPEDRLEAVTRRLARTSEAHGAPRQHRRWREEARDEMDERPSRRRRQYRDIEPEEDRAPAIPAFDPRAIVDDAAAIVERRLSQSERQTAQALNNLANLIKRNQREGAAGEGLAVKRAVEVFTQRAEESERQTARALNDIAGILENEQRDRAQAENGIVTLAERLARIESRLSEQPGPGATVRPIRNALARLESRLDRLSSEDRTAEFESALTGLDQRLADIARRLDEEAREREARDLKAREEKSRAHQERENFERDGFERTRAAGRQAHMEPPRVDVSGSALEQGLRPASSATRRPLVEAIAEITQRQRSLDDAYAAPSVQLNDDPQVKQRFESLQGTIDAIAKQIDGVREDATERADQQLVTMRQIEGLRREVQDVAHTVGQLAPRASIHAVEDALRDLSFRVEAQRDRGIAEDLLAPAERIASEVRAAIRELDPSPIVRTLHQDVLTIGHRLNAIQDELGRPGSVDSEAIRVLAQQTHEIRDQLYALASRPLPLEKIETRLFDLTQRVDSLSLSAGSASSDMTELVKGIRSIVAAESSRGFETFNQRLENLALKFDEVVGNAGAERFDALDHRIEELGKSLAQRIDRNAPKPIDTAPLEKIAGRLEEAVARANPKRFDEDKLSEKLGDKLGAKLGAKLGEHLGDNFGKQLSERLDEQLGASLGERIGERLDQRLGARIEEVGKNLAQRIDSAKPADTAPLEQLVASLARKIDSTLDQNSHTAGIEEIGRKIDRLETRIDSSAPTESFARIEAMLARPAHEKQFAEIAQRIDQLHKTLAARLEHGATSEPGDVRYIEELVRGLDQKIEAALGGEGKQIDVQGIERQISQLSYKIDRLEDPVTNPRLGALLARPPHNPQLDEISERLERMQAALADRVNESARVEERHSDLAALVENLARRVNQALDPQADASALKSLEHQIGALSKRLDRTGPNADALAGIEARISDLVSRIEDTRAVTTQAAEEAVRRATQEILREATAAAPGALRGEVEREISAIRKTHEESGQRTHETLLAVHETLERVVDRLAMFEDELSEIRSEPAPKAAAPSVAPVAPTKEAASSSAQPTRRVSDAAAATTPSPRTRNIRLDAADDEDLMDFLLPPGGAPAPRREPSLGAEPPRRSDAPSAPTDFIAAARRAAQQAAADAEAAEQAQQTRRGVRAAASGAGNAPRAAANMGADVEADGGSPVARVSSVIQERKRPLLLGLGALVLLVGAYQIARVSIDGAVRPESATHEQHEVVAPEDSTGEATPPASAPAKAPTAQAPAKEVAPAAEAQPAPAPRELTPPPPAPRMIAPPVAKPGAKSTDLGQPVDPTPTGAINPASPLTPGDALGAIKTLAVKGDAAAQFEFGARLAEGRGVARDPKGAAEWFEKAAQQGLPPAQYRLGSMYEKGLGVERNYAQARKWYQSAAEAGNARSMHNLAVLLAEGGDGKPDYGAASQWFQKAAELGVRDSQYNLAILYARGLGVTQSLPQSYAWFAAAADQGDDDARKKRDEVGARLDSKDLAAAKALTSNFKPKAPPREANDVLPPPGGWEAVKVAPPPAARQGGKAKVSQI